MTDTLNMNNAHASEPAPLQLATASGGGAGATGAGGNGGAGGSSEGGGTGGNAGSFAGEVGTPQKGGDGGGNIILVVGKGGQTGAMYPAGGTITADIKGETGGTAQGGGGGGGAGVTASGTLTVNASVLGGDGGAGGETSLFMAGGGGGGTGLLFTGPGRVTVNQSGVVTGGSSLNEGSNANGGGAVGLYFDGDHAQDSSLVNRGAIRGGNSIGGGGGAAVVLTDNVVLNNQGTILGGIADLASDGSKQAGGAGVLVLGDYTVISHTATGATIEGGSSPDATVPIPPAIRMVGNTNEVYTSSHILGGTNLSDKSRGNAIELLGIRGKLGIQNGYSFSGNVVCNGQGPYILQLGGPTDVANLDLSTIGPVGSDALLQGFTQFEKVGNTTWTLTGRLGTAGLWTIWEGVLKLSGTGDLSLASDILIGEGTGASPVLDISSVSAGTSTVQRLSGTRDARVILGEKTLVIANGVGIFEGVISGAGGVTIATPTFQTFSGNNSYTGMTTVEGRLVLNGALSGDVTVAAILVMEAATISGTVTVGEYSYIDIGVGSKTIKGDLVFINARSHVRYYPIPITPDALMIKVNGNVNLNNVTVSINPLAGSYAPGTYGLIEAGGKMTGVATHGSLPPGGTLQVLGNRLNLVVAG
ncbi:hypothetical protein [Mesorhizobium sp. RMAD-H1]|uniref:hypothetical protein n=1 Tax=Mesorhizobium sp. RMAD-H1 TaxID=2587065 RepID=UPI00161E6C32|nr:hypothetical protein [Mesorhizobium sp. RMAD-H1]MBB2970317.1 hypothetical protein [Mesorhizobium sp. RMAD-H1]